KRIDVGGRGNFHELGRFGCMDEIRVSGDVFFINTPEASKFMEVATAAYIDALQQALVATESGSIAMIEGLGWFVADFLAVQPPADEDLTFQILEGYDPDNTILIGWTGEDLDFVWDVVEEQTGHKNKALWKHFQAGMKTETDGGKLKTKDKGKITTNSDLSIEYRVFTWKLEGESYGQMINLINGEHATYWVMAQPVGVNELESTTQRSLKILKSAVLLK
ncbi:MAG: hypothetical protein AAF438_15905, partial [Pseudomonadota bacterium]